jgi:hypothetical protein
MVVERLWKAADASLYTAFQTAQNVSKESDVTSTLSRLTEEALIKHNTSVSRCSSGFDN